MCRDKIRKTTARKELQLARNVRDKKKGFSQYVTHKRKH